MDRAPLSLIRHAGKTGELWRNVGDGADQAALCDGVGTTSMPSWNLTPAITFGNWFPPVRCC
ncbi:hypothetical protein [Microvirga massiliensis]|uniref:hypothetical protein n=1 Tax=Microvirga massiliensis TaxID=1033741 RepID=UPI00062B743A